MINFKRAWLLSDLHFGIKNNNKDFLNTQLDYFNNFFIPLIKKDKQLDDVLIILGDIFDSRQTINIFVLNKLIFLHYNNAITPIQSKRTLHRHTYVNPLGAIIAANVLEVHIGIL